MQPQAGAESEHHEFLATDASDPRPAFVSALCDALGSLGSIVVYHQQFESQRLSDLASWVPEFSGRIEKIQRRLWDLLPIIRDHVYHPAFGGSYSLKSVLPALVPEMSYGGMEVADGQDAGLASESLVRGEMDERERGQDEESAARLLRAGHAGASQVIRKTQLARRRLRIDSRSLRAPTRSLQRKRFDRTLNPEITTALLWEIRELALSRSARKSKC